MPSDMKGHKPYGLPTRRSWRLLLAAFVLLLVVTIVLTRPVHRGTPTQPCTLLRPVGLICKAQATSWLTTAYTAASPARALQRTVTVGHCVLCTWEVLSECMRAGWLLA